MKLEEIKKIIKENIIYGEILVNTDNVVKEIYKLHLEDKIESMKELRRDPDYLYTTMYEIDVAELEQELKTLEQ